MKQFEFIPLPALFDGIERFGPLLEMDYTVRSLL